MTGLTGWQSVVLGLGAVLITGVVALIGHWISRRNAKESQQLLWGQHRATTHQWGVQHEQWRSDYDQLHMRWQREQSFTLLDQAITRALSGEPRTCLVGVVQLRALRLSKLVHEEDLPLLRTVMETVTAVAEPVVGSMPEARVVIDDSSAEGLNAEAPSVGERG